MRTLDTLCQELQKRYSEVNSWQKTAEGYGINKAMARLIAKGYQPGKKIRKRLDLPEIAQVIAISGNVPDGTQVIMASRCTCGKYYISNHPRRKKCFICSPYRRQVAPSPTANYAQNPLRHVPARTRRGQESD